MRASIASLSLILAAVPASLLSASCSSTSGGASAGDAGPTSGCSYKSTADLTTPTVSFQNDVLPVFEHSCGISSSCHNDPSVIPTRGIFLGCDMNTSMTCAVMPPVAPKVYPHIVGATADKPLETSMPYITPGDPSMSFLMYKMDDNLCGQMGCKANNNAVSQAGDTPAMVGAPNWCGTFMPYNVQPLDVATRDTIRRWIAQGAKNN